MEYNYMINGQKTKYFYNKSVEKAHEFIRGMNRQHEKICI